MELSHTKMLNILTLHKDDKIDEILEKETEIIVFNCSVNRAKSTVLPLNSLLQSKEKSFTNPLNLTLLSINQGTLASNLLRFYEIYVNNHSFAHFFSVFHGSGFLMRSN